MFRDAMAIYAPGILALGWYTIFMLITLPVLAIAWGIYIWWNKKMDAVEEEARKKGSHRLQKTKSEVSDWAQQMAKMESPKRRPPNSKPPGAQ